MSEANSHCKPELADRLASAMKGSRLLDQEIYRKVYNPETPFWIAPKYSTSVDAGLTLVPEWWAANLSFSEDKPECELHCRVSLSRSYPTNLNIYVERSGLLGHRTLLPLALAEAAIRALKGENYG